MQEAYVDPSKRYTIHTLNGDIVQDKPLLVDIYDGCFAVRQGPMARAMAQAVTRGFETGLLVPLSPVHTDYTPFGERETQVLACASQGMSVHETATNLGKSPFTVKTQRAYMAEKAQFGSVESLVLLGYMTGVLTLPNQEALDPAPIPALPAAGDA